MTRSTTASIDRHLGDDVDCVHHPEKGTSSFYSYCSLCSIDFLRFSSNSDLPFNIALRNTCSRALTGQLFKMPATKISQAKKNIVIIGETLALPIDPSISANFMLIKDL